jgi:hypothetical protein
MPSGDVQYLVGFEFPDCLERGRDNVVVCPVYLNGSLVAPSVYTCTLYDPSGVVVSSPTVTLVDSVATATIPTSEIGTKDFGAGWRVEWALTLGGVVRTFSNEAAIVRKAFECCVNDQVLFDHHSDLRALLASSKNGSVQKAIWQAFVTFQNRMWENESRAFLIFTTTAPREHLKWQALGNAFEGLAANATDDDGFQKQADKYFDRAEKAFQNMKFKTDTNQDGTSDSTVAQGPKGTTFLTDLRPGLGWPTTDFGS